jgi:hypothetical protein
MISEVQGSEFRVAGYELRGKGRLIPFVYDQLGLEFIQKLGGSKYFDLDV